MRVRAAGPPADHRPDIDGLRAVAVLAVVAFHAVPGRVAGGFIGVDVFFVISGFLITGIILRALAAGTFRLSDFYERRIRRIFPALALVLATAWLFGAVALFVDEYAQLGRHIAAGAGFVANLVSWSEAGYFDAVGETKPLLHLWSLGVEEQFYIAWPILLWLAWQRRWNVAALITVLGLVSFTLGVAMLHDDAAAAFYAPQARFWELMCGSLIACAAAPMRERLATPVSLAGFAALAGGLALIDRESDFPGFWALLPVLGAAAIIRAGPRAWPNRRLLAHPLLVWIGLISYPLYLWHWVLLSYARIVAGEAPGIGVRLGLVAVSVPLAWATMAWIERPMRTGGGGRRKASALFAGVLLIGLAGWFTLARDGWPDRYEASPNDYASRRWHLRGEGVTDCADAVRGTQAGFCATTSRPRVALIGDSHAGALFHGVVGSAISSDYRAAMVLGAGGCPPALGVEARKGCARQLEAALGRVADPGIPVVMLVAYHGFAEAADPDAARRYREGFDRTLERLRRLGKKIVFVVDNPSLPVSAEQCAPKPLAIRRLFREAPAFCTDPTRLVPRDTGGYPALVRQLRESNRDVLFYDPKGVLCPGGACRIFADAKLLYADWNHLSTHGSRLVGDDLVSTLVAAFGAN